MECVLRTQAAARVELRAAGPDSKSVGTAVGYASVFDQWTTLLDLGDLVIREVIRPGAFREALAGRQDVFALDEHDWTRTLGRSSSGTLRLREDARGLAVEIDIAGTSVGNDVAELLRRGDKDKMSFGFLPRDGGEAVTQRMQGGVTVIESEITSVDLYDVSTVGLPAYSGTSVGLRRRLTPRERRRYDVVLGQLRLRRLKLGTGRTS